MRKPSRRALLSRPDAGLERSHSWLRASHPQIGAFLNDTPSLTCVVSQHTRPKTVPMASVSRAARRRSFKFSDRHERRANSNRPRRPAMLDVDAFQDFRVGLARLRDGDAIAAIELLRQAAKRDPENPYYLA
jgi:hypothetical protein